MKKGRKNVLRNNMIKQEEIEKPKNRNSNRLVLFLSFDLLVGWATLLSSFMILAKPSTLDLLVAYGLGMISTILFIIFGFTVGLWLGDKIVQILKRKAKRS